MTQIMIGKRYWKAGDRRHVWVVDGIVAAAPGREAYAILVSEEGSEAEDVDLTHLEDPEQFTALESEPERDQNMASYTEAAATPDPRDPER